jgi:hypothetical protein
MTEPEKPKPKRKRRMRKTTQVQSLRILKQIFKGQDDFLGINWENHRKVELEKNKNVYRITIEILSLEPILKLTEHERVKNVYWHPSYAPPGTGKDAIALRYRLYVEYV